MPHVGVTDVPIWVSELHVALASVSGEPQVPPDDPPSDPPDDDPDAPLDPEELPDPEDEPPASVEAPELLPLDEAPLDDVEASSVAPASSADVPELELELQANEAPAPSATSATHHPATGNALDIVMVLSPAPCAGHERFLGTRHPPASRRVCVRTMVHMPLVGHCGRHVHHGSLPGPPNLANLTLAPARRDA